MPQLCARCSSGAVNCNQRMVDSLRGQALETEEKGKTGKSAQVTFLQLIALWRYLRAIDCKTSGENCLGCLLRQIC